MEIGKQNMTQKTLHTFDMTHEISITDFLTILNDFDLKLESSTPIGPAGGNPNITVSGSEIFIESFKKYLKHGY
tara:strand:+ start:267 stop:488 length:222 start_codon:yes stop_codon:yes gene_type:complete